MASRLLLGYRDMTDKLIPSYVYAQVDRYFGAVVFDGGTVEGDASAFSGGLPDSSTQEADGVTWSWAATFTPAQEDEWDRIIRIATRKSAQQDEVANDAIIESSIATMKAFRYRTQDPSAAQTWQTMDSIIDVLRLILHDDG